MSTFKHHTSCDSCGSSDANAVYEDNTYCWACQATVRLDTDKEETDEIFEKVEKPTTTDVERFLQFPVRGFRERGITKAVSEFYGVRCTEQGDNVTEHYYPYTKDGHITAYKKRIVEGKKFSTIGDFKGVQLFGQDKFSGNDRKVVITEGELDTMAVAKAHLDKYGKVYPCVSIPNGASALQSILDNREWLRSFEEVILMMDNDEPGQKAMNEIAKVIGPDKVKIAKLSVKDASDSLLASGGAEIISAVWNASNWCPAGIINSSNTWDMYEEESKAVYTPYPSFVQGLNDKIYGRRLGSITTFTSGTGSGKTSFLREDAFHLLNSTDSKIGICSLEESVAETVRGFISLDLSKRVGLPGVDSSLEEQKGAFDRTMGPGRFEILDHQGSVSDDSLIDKIEYLACICDYIYLDHITIAISDSDKNQNQAMDKFMSDLLKICKRHNVWIGVVSHLRKSNQEQESFEQGAEINEDSLKGSGSLKQISAQIIALERNKHAEEMSERHKVKVKVLKDRFGGDTGVADYYKFDFETGRLSSAKPAGFEDIS